jgi:hypothetical protein
MPRHGQIARHGAGGQQGQQPGQEPQPLDEADIALASFFRFRLKNGAAADDTKRFPRRPTRMPKASAAFLAGPRLKKRRPAANCS